MKHGLGRGMMALLDEQDGTRDEINRADTIDINKIMPNRYQPRKTFNEDALKQLAESIRDKGVLQPIIVTELGDGRYELVAGERRWRASKMAGLLEIPAIIKDFSDEDKLEIALIENIQREDLNPLEKAEAFKEIIERLNLSQDDLAKKIGKDRSSVTNTLRLLKLPEFVRDRIATGEISEGHARAILALEDIDSIIELTRFVIEKGLSVRETELAVRNYHKDSVPAKPKKSRRHNTEIDDIQERIIKAMGAKVEIKGTLHKGRIEIHYFSKEDLENIYGYITSSK
jgi:ParB family chromosome partitioning protein